MEPDQHPAQQPAPPPLPPQQPRATWTDVTVELHGSAVLRNFTHAASDGMLIGLIGVPSAGLTAALLTLAGRFRPASGNVAIVGAPTSVAVVSADAGGPSTLGEGDPLQRVREAVAESARVPRGVTAAAHLERAMVAAGIAELAERPVVALNSYERVLLTIAMAAASGAAMLAVDAAGADVEPARSHLMVLLSQLAASGRLVLVAASSPHEAMNAVVAIPTPLEV